MSILKAAFLTLANHLPHLKISDSVRWRLYRWAGVEIEGPCLICGPFAIRPIGGARNISIAKGAVINTHTRFGCPIEKIRLGRDCMIGPNVSFETVNHGLQHVPGKGRGGWAKPITVEEEVWIGCGAIVLQGVTIGRGSVIAAGSVVTRSIPPGVLAAGVPAKVVRTL